MARRARRRGSRRRGAEEAEQAWSRGAEFPGVLGLHRRPPAPAAAPTSLLRSTPPSPPPPVRGGADRGWNPPRWLGLGARVARWRSTYSGRRRWTCGRRRCGWARGRITTTPPARRGDARPTGVTKEERRGGDDGDGMPTQARRDVGPTGQRVLSESGRWWCSRAELGPKGEGGSIGWLQPT
jgi:hypothetical protein